MQCKSCGYAKSEVVETRHDDKHNSINRRRMCLRCGLRFTTHEFVKESKRSMEDKK